MARRLFCELSPAAYEISVFKERTKRHVKDALSGVKFAKAKAEETQTLHELIYSHKSLIRRQLGDVDLSLQENKAVNLSIAAPKVNGVLIHPGETFSFWRLVENCTENKGYLNGLTITGGKTAVGIGGGMCQFTNLLHWLSLHSPLQIIERHHHDGVDLFPDFDRQVPFGVGTSILYNYLDYRVKNTTGITFQFIVYTTDTYLCGELRASETLPHKYHIVEEDKHFVKLDGEYYRRNRVYKTEIDKKTGNELSRELIQESNAKVMYGEEFINKDLIRI